MVDRPKPPSLARSKTRQTGFSRTGEKFHHPAAAGTGKDGRRCVGTLLPSNELEGMQKMTEPVGEKGYAGDVTPEQAAQWMASGEAVLVDVRTDAEREWVGFVPGAVPLAWKQWPGMALNPGFDEGVRAAGEGGKKVVLLCRSGVRSIAAAKRATELGVEAYNILEGFEGNPDESGHRGQVGGWRKRGLPWKQN